MTCDVTNHAKCSSLVHLVILLVISLVTRQVECQVASGTVGDLTNSINSNCVDHSSQEIEQESCIQGDTSSQAETILQNAKSKRNQADCYCSHAAGRLAYWIGESLQALNGVLVF